MSLLQINTITSLNASCSQPRPAYISPFPHSSSMKTHWQLHNSLISFSAITTRDGLFTLSTHHRKLLCKHPQGKNVREDYLVKKTAEEIRELVRGERNVPLIIDFYATWCRPCILIAQELEMVNSRRIWSKMGCFSGTVALERAVEYESIAMIVKVDTDDEYEFVLGMQVRDLPTLFFISPDPKKDAIQTEGLSQYR